MKEFIKNFKIYKKEGVVESISIVIFENFVTKGKFMLYWRWLKLDEESEVFRDLRFFFSVIVMLKVCNYLRRFLRVRKGLSQELKRFRIRQQVFFSLFLQS